MKKIILLAICTIFLAGMTAGYVCNNPGDPCFNDQYPLNNMLEYFGKVYDENSCQGSITRSSSGVCGSQGGWCGLNNCCHIYYCNGNVLNAYGNIPIRGLGVVVNSPGTVTSTNTFTNTGSISQTDISCSCSGNNCLAHCGRFFMLDTLVTLTATPNEGYVFGGWTGACSGSNNVCTVYLDQSRLARAFFCPVGSSWNGEECVSGNFCPPGSSWDGQECVPEDFCYDPETENPEPLSTILDSSRITHYWPFNGNANDLHGGKTGTLRNNPTFTEGKFGNALTLNGIDQYVTLSPNFANTQSVTVGGWIYYNESQEGRVSCILTDMDAVSGNDFEFCITHNGLRLRAHKSGALLNDNIVLDGIDFRNSWNHIVWVMESTQSRVFVNGTQVALIEKSGSNVGFHYTPQIGRRYDGGGTRGGAWEFNYFKGKIDELFYTTEILTDCEIKQLALGPTACLPVCEVPEQESFIEVTLGNDGTGYLIQWDALHMTYTIPSQGNISIELAFSNGESRSYYLNDQTSLHHYLEPINTDAHNVTLLVGLKGDAEIYNISFDKTTIEEVENTFSLCCSQDSVGVQFNNSGITEKFVCSVIPDGVCPEDFEDADGNRISCAAFRDPDCGYDSRFYRSNLFQRLMQLTFEERSYIISTNNNESARLTVIDEENQIGIGTGTYTYDFRILSEVSSEHSVSEIVFSYAQTPPTIIFDNTEVLECSSTPSPTCYIWYDGSYTLELHHTLSDHSLRVIFTYRHISWILILLIAILGLLPVLLVLHGKKMLHYIENTMAKRLSDDIERLGIHVRKLKKSGKTKEHIHSTMAEAGWKKHLVELALHQLDAGKGSDKKIIEYIKTCKGHGVKNSEIYIALLSAGWEREKIDEVFKKL